MFQADAGPGGGGGRLGAGEEGGLRELSTSASYTQLLLRGSEGQPATTEHGASTRYVTMVFKVGFFNFKSS